VDVGFVPDVFGGNRHQVESLEAQEQGQRFLLEATYVTLASNVVGGVSQPIFDGGTLLHRKRAADQALKQAAYEYQTAVITAYQNVADTLHAAVSDADALSAAVAAENAAKVALDLTRRQMEVGYVNYLTLLTAQTAYSQALLNRIQAQATRFGDTVALFQALGGGWWNRSERTAKAATP
jgi:outer membrane protein TolC